MNPCSRMAPQKRPDPGHSRNSLGSGGRRPGLDGRHVEGEITGIIIGLVMMESRMMQDFLAQKIRAGRGWKQHARLAALAGALGLVALAGLGGGAAPAPDRPD